MPTTLREGDVVESATTVQAPPEAVYAVVSDVTRIPEWSPECVRCVWIDEAHFKGWNRRRLGRWSTVARVVVAEPGREFSFVVQMMGADFTQWTYKMEPDPTGGTRLTEQVRMCVDLPWAALMFERVLLRVRDRRVDLRDNLARSLDRVKVIVEAP